ncbi:MAG TPA: Sec-independent protein translocase protein TatB [Mycobacterium sp.]|nr:Sec-independent protein translocase protein TatB [Mycobacterium sp.]
MFANLSWEHILVLVVVGLVILGPERLPGAIRWTSTTLRQARDYLSGMTSQLRQDLGPEFDELRGPISELQKLRGMTPRAALTKHLLDGDDSFLTGNFDRPVNGAPPNPVEPSGPVARTDEQHAPGPAPFDTDAT